MDRGGGGGVGGVGCGENWLFVKVGEEQSEGGGGGRRLIFIIFPKRLTFDFN